MGQYYKIVNVDKREMLEPFDYGNGMKLMEWSYDRNPMVLALMNLLADRWAGDRVFVIGDYADAENPDEPCHNAVVKLMEELHTDDLYEWASKKCDKIVPERGDPNVRDRFMVDASTPIVADCRADTKDNGLVFVVNHGTRQYIDLRKCPVEWTWHDDDNGESGVTRIAAISLLLAMGNDRGGGDFREGNAGYEYVGSWCDTSDQIEVCTQLPVEAAEYDEFEPGFTEKGVDQGLGHTVDSALRPDAVV